MKVKEIGNDLFDVDGWHCIYMEIDDVLWVAETEFPGSKAVPIELRESDAWKQAHEIEKLLLQRR